MDNNNIEHVTKPTDVTVSRSSGLSSISNSPLGFSLESEAFETLELSDILLNNEPDKPNDLLISENAVTDHNSDSLNVEMLSSEENQSDAISSGRSQIIFSSEDSDCHESMSISSSKSSMSEAHAKENNSGTKESVPVITQEKDKVEISVATDKSHADIDEMSIDNIDISEKCISKTSFLGITKSTDDRSFDEKTVINDKEEVNNGSKWKIEEEQDKRGKEPKSCSEKLEKSHRVVDTKYVSLEIPGSETSAMDDQNSSCSGCSSEKGAKFEEKMLSSDRCQSVVIDSDEQPTHTDSSDSQAGSSQLTDNEMEEKEQGHSVAVKRDHEREKNTDLKQKCREIKQPIIKLADFMLNTSSKTNREDKKLSHKSKRSWAVKLTTPVSNLSRKRSGKEDDEEKMSFEEQVNQSIFSEKSRNEKPFVEEEKVQDNKLKKEQTTSEERHLENKNAAPAIQTDDLDKLNAKDEVSVKVKVGFSLNGVLSESVSVESIVSSSTSDPQQHANINGEETIVGNDDSVNRNMQDKSHAQLSSNFPSHHPSSSKHAIPAIKRKMAINTLDIVPIDGKIPTIKLHKMNHAGHLPSSSQTISVNKIAKLKTEVTPGCSGSNDNTQSVHGIQSHAVKKRMHKPSTVSEKWKRDIRRSDPISVDGKVPVIKLQRIQLGEKQEKTDMQMNINSLEESSDRKLRKRSLSPDQGKGDSKKKNQSPSKQSGIHFETSCFESDEEDSLFSKDLLDSLLEKVTADNSQKLGKELNILKEDKKRDGDFTPVMNVESGGFTGALGGPLANMPSIASRSLLGHRFSHDSKRQSSGRIKSDSDLQKKMSDTVRKAGIDKKLMSCSSDSDHYNGLKKTKALKEISDHQDEQQDETCNDNSKHLLPKNADEVDPEVEALIRKLKCSSHKKRKNLEPVVLLTRIDDEHINLADTSLKGYDLNFTQKKQTDTFGLKGNEKNVLSQKQMEFKSNCHSSRKLVVPLDRVDLPIKTGNISRQSTEKKSKTKSSSVNDKHEESIKVEVHASWSEMDSDISGGNIKFKERNAPFETSPSPSKKVRKDQELNNEVLGTVTDKTNKKSLDSTGVIHRNISENVWKLKPDNFPVSCATCTYLSSPDSRLIKETYAGKGILSRHVIVAIQRLDSEIDCASTSSLNIKEEKADQRKKHAERKKIRLREENKKHVHRLTEEDQDSKSDHMMSSSEAGRPWKLNIQCETEASGSEKEDAKSLVMKIRKVLTNKEESDLKDLCLPKGKPNDHGKDVPLSGEVDINIYSTRVKLEKLDVENTPHQFHLKIPHQDRSCFNPEAFNGESGPSSKGIAKGKSEDNCVTTDSGKLMSNKLSSCKQCTKPFGEKSCGTGETLNSSSAFLQLPDDDTDETAASTSKNQTGVTALLGRDSEMTKAREISDTRSDQKIRDKELYPVDSEPESDGAASPFPEPLVDDDVKPQGMDTSIDSMGTLQDEPLIKREKENGDSSQLIPESPNVHRSPSDPWPKLSQGKTDKSDSSAGTDISSTHSPQDASQRKKLLEAYKRRLDTIQDKDHEYEDPGTVKETHIRRSLSFSDEDSEGYKIRPGVIILDPR